MDYSQYSPDWKDIIRPEILKRDNYRCITCGIKHKSRVFKNTRGQYMAVDEFEENFATHQGKKVFTLYLQVAHLDHDKKNNSPSNLRTLCPVHHSKYDAVHKALTRKIYKGEVVQAPPEPTKPQQYFSDLEILDYQAIITDKLDLFLTKHKAHRLLIITSKFLKNE